MKIKKELLNLKTSATLAINELSKKLEKEGKEIFKFGLGQSPFPIPNSIVKELKKHSHQKNYLNVSGLEKLREVIKYHILGSKIQVIELRKFENKDGKQIISLKEFSR